jgi:hypothetical protein
MFLPVKRFDALYWSNPEVTDLSEIDMPPRVCDIAQMEPPKIRPGKTPANKQPPAKQPPVRRHPEKPPTPEELDRLRADFARDLAKLRAEAAAKPKVRYLGVGERCEFAHHGVVLEGLVAASDGRFADMFVAGKIIRVAVNKVLDL